MPWHSSHLFVNCFHVFHQRKHSRGVGESNNSLQLILGHAKYLVAIVVSHLGNTPEREMKIKSWSNRKVFSPKYQKPAWRSYLRNTPMSKSERLNLCGQKKSCDHRWTTTSLCQMLNLSVKGEKQSHLSALAVARSIRSVRHGTRVLTKNVPLAEFIVLEPWLHFVCCRRPLQSSNGCLCWHWWREKAKNNKCIAPIFFKSCLIVSFWIIAVVVWSPPPHASSFFWNFWVP